MVPRYMELLAAGGSRSPQELGEMVGVDLADPGFWSAGLDLVERQLAGGRSGRRGLRAPLAERALSRRGSPWAA